MRLAIVDSFDREFAAIDIAVGSQYNARRVPTAFAVKYNAMREADTTVRLIAHTSRGLMRRVLVRVNGRWYTRVPHI